MILSEDIDYLDNNKVYCGYNVRDKWSDTFKEVNVTIICCCCGFYHTGYSWLHSRLYGGFVATADELYSFLVHMVTIGFPDDQCIVRS